VAMQPTTQPTMPVSLNIYRWQWWLPARACPLFHTSITVNGTAYSYGKNGVQESQPGQEFMYAPHDTKLLGFFHVDASRMEDLCTEWNNKTYNLLENNCNHFTDAVISELLGMCHGAQVGENPRMLAALMAARQAAWELYASDAASPPGRLERSRWMTSYAAAYLCCWRAMGPKRAALHQEMTKQDRAPECSREALEAREKDLFRQCGERADVVAACPALYMFPGVLDVA